VRENQKFAVFFTDSCRKTGRSGSPAQRNSLIEPFSADACCHIAAGNSLFFADDMVDVIDDVSVYGAEASKFMMLTSKRYSLCLPEFTGPGCSF
jgi:hypothetical protein